MGARSGNSGFVAMAIATTVAGLTLHAMLGPAGTFWTVDDAGKAIVLREIAHDPGSPSIEYAGIALDPEYALFPQPLTGSEPYAVLKEGRVTSQYHAPFVWLSLPVFKLLGYAGLAFWPALGAGAAVFWSARLAALSASASAGLWAAVILVAASPLLFYASVFWEHTLTIALSAASFVAMTRRRAFTAGLALGGAALFREELVLLVLAAFLAAHAQREPRMAWRIAMGGAIGVAARAVFHIVATGSVLGVHAGLNRSEPFVHVLEAARGLVFGAGFSGFASGVTAAALLLLGVSLVLRRQWSALASTAGAVLLAAVAWLGWRGFPGHEDAALALVHSNSAALFLPWALAVPFLRIGNADALRLPALTALLFLALFLVVVPERSITGVHPGPRMLLPVLPVAAAIAARCVVASRRNRLLLAPLFLAAAFWNFRSLELLHWKRETAGRMVAALAAAPERIVVSDLFWLPTEMASLWDRKQFHLLRRDADMETVVTRASAAGTLSILAAAPPGRIPGEAVARVRHERLPEFSVDVHRLVLGASSAAQPPDPAVPPASDP